MTGADVVERFRDGDPDAVRAVYRDFGRLVFAAAFRTLGDRDLAEEATQETFVRAWRAAATFDPSRELGPWLATIARRVAIDLHRRESRRPHESLDAAEGAAVPSRVEQALDAWEVRDAIEELAPDERLVVKLQHLEGLSHGEIAERLAIPIGTVKSRSHRAHRHLAARLGHLRESPNP